MTQEEVKSRNIALATYMGWVFNEEEGCWQYADGTGWLAPPNPPFHEDMNLLMPVVWKFAFSGYSTKISAGVSIGMAHIYDSYGLLVSKGTNLPDANASPALAIWKAVSSLVMELQQKDV